MASGWNNGERTKCPSTPPIIRGSMKKIWIFGVGAVVSQSLAIALVLWLVKDRLGAEMVGLWSLILSTLSITSISQFGLGQSLIHFSQVALKREQETGQTGQVRQYYDTTILVTLGVFILVVLALFWPLKGLIGQIAGSELTGVLDQVMPVAAASMVMAILSRVPQAALNGLSRFWFAQASIIAGAVLYAVLAWVLIGSYGLLGVAYAHLAMALCQLVLAHAGVVYIAGSGRNLIQRILVGRPRLRLVREMIGLGLSLQAMSMLLFLLEPIARVAMGYAGGLAMVGYYEMASRVAIAARDVFARPMAYLSGHFARQARTAPEKVPTDLAASFDRSLALGTLSLAAIAASALILADIWVQERHWFFFYCLGFLSFGWAYTSLALGTYNYGIGTGQNRHNLIGMAVICGTAGACSLVAALLGEPLLVPIGVCLGLVVGESYIITAYSRMVGIGIASYFSAANGLRLLKVAVYIAAVLPFSIWLTGQVPVLAALAILGLAGLFGVFWLFPRKVSSVTNSR